MKGRQVKQLVYCGLENLPEIARSLLPMLHDNPFVAVYGEMGAGKTTLIRAIVRELGSEDRVTSPTFSLVNEYHMGHAAANRIYHFDFYRIETLEEVYDIGYEEYFGSGHYCFVEWADKIEPLLPDDCIKFQITKAGDNENCREITIFKR